MFNKFAGFAKNEDGSAMVDWVVLTAALTGLSVAILLNIGGGVEAVAANTAETVQNVDFD